MCEKRTFSAVKPRNTERLHGARRPLPFSVPNAAVLPQIGHTIEAGIAELRQYTGCYDIETWAEMDVAGRFIVDGVLERINTADFVVADISRLNFAAIPTQRKPNEDEYIIAGVSRLAGMVDMHVP